MTKIDKTLAELDVVLAQSNKLEKMFDETFRILAFALQMSDDPKIDGLLCFAQECMVGYTGRFQTLRTHAAILSTLDGPDEQELPF